jgi:hypothetical protein
MLPIDRDTLCLILNEQGQFYKVDAAGNIVLTNIPTWLSEEDEPDGWAEETIKYIRNPVSVGVFRSMSVQFSFKKNSAKILRYIYKQRRIQAYARFVILYRNNLNQFEGMYAGTVDFSQKRDNEEGFDANIMESGLIEMIKANQSKNYEIDIDVNEAVTVYWTGVRMYSQTSMTSYRDSQLDNTSGAQVPIVRDGRYIHLGFLANSGENQYPSLVFNGFSAYLETEDYNNIKTAWQDDWDFRATQETTITMKNAIRVTMFGGMFMFTLKLYVYNEINGSSREIFIANQYINGEIPFDVQFTLQEGEKCWVFIDNYNDVAFEFFRPSPIGGPAVDPNDIIDMSYTYIKEPTEVKVLRALYVLDQLIKKMTNSVYGATSELLAELGIGYDFCLTMGKTIRGFTGTKIITSLDAFTKSYNTRFNTGYGVDQNGLIFEQKQHFYNDNLIVDLGEAVECEFSPYLEGIPSSVKIGWPNDSMEDVNGLQEFNNIFEWGTPITKQAKEWDLVAEYQTGCFIAEKLRINLEGKTTTDDDNDNKVFIINIAPISFTGSVAFAVISGENRITTDGVFQSVVPGGQITVTGSDFNNSVFNVISVQQFVSNTAIIVQEALTDEVSNVTLKSNKAVLNRPVYDNVQGLLSPDTVFNMECRPGLCIRAHGNVLRAGLQTLETEKITFQTTYKNRDLVVTSNGVTIKENADILIGSLTPGLFVPELATAKFKVPLFISTLIEAQPYGQVKWTWKGAQWYGFIMEAGQNKIMDDPQTYKLLLSNKSDLQNTID